MFNIDKFYIEAEQGNFSNHNDFKEYINSFENVIIWGAGNLGTAIGKIFLEQGIRLTAFWDIKHKEKKECIGIPVLETFSGKFNIESSLIIVGIVNGTLSHNWQISEIKRNGYNNILRGMEIYEAIVCPMKKGENFNVKYCTQTNICNFNTCKKYMNLLKNPACNDTLAIQVVEFIVSRRCTLDCVNCGQQVGVIKRRFPEKYFDYKLERIKEDIDIIMNNVDLVGTFSIIGGEPFIHPKIADIIEHCLTKNNVAIISITTNGICKITDDILNKIKNDRVKINFSNYTQTLDDKEKQLYYANLEKMKNAGVNCNDTTPIWNSISDELRKECDFSDEFLTQCKDRCVMGPSVSNGVFYACPITELYDKTELISVEEDSIDLTKENNIREKIKLLINKPFHKTCGYRCGNAVPGKQVIPGEQMN